MADNGTEFINLDMQCFIKEKGITLYTSVPYMHEQNGVAKHAIHTITEGVQAMLYTSKLLKNLWSIALRVSYDCHKICSDGVEVKKIVGITRQFPCYSYTAGPYGKGPTGNYTTCT